MYTEHIEAMNAEALHELDQINAEGFGVSAEVAVFAELHEPHPSDFALSGAMSVFQSPAIKSNDLNRKGILALAQDANLPISDPTMTALQIATIERVRLFADTIRARLRSQLEQCNSKHFDAVSSEAESVGVELKFIGGGEKWEGEEVYGHSARWRELQLELKSAKARAAEIVAAAQSQIESHEMAMKQCALANRIGQEVVSYDTNGEEIPMAKSTTEKPTLRITLK